MSEPIWLERVVVDALHAAQLREHGGLMGTRDENALESALARPRQRWHYGGETDLASLAAGLGFGLVANHPYLDGNKRAAFVAMVVFLELNGGSFDATEAEVVTAMLAVASGRSSEEELADWLRAHR